MTYIRQTTDELVRKRLNACLFDKFLLCFERSVLPLSTDETELDIGIDGVVEETGLLLYEPDLSPPPLQVNVSEGPATDSDGTVAPVKALS